MVIVARGIDSMNEMACMGGFEEWLNKIVEKDKTGIISTLNIKRYLNEAFEERSIMGKQIYFFYTFGNKTFLELAKEFGIPTDSVKQAYVDILQSLIEEGKRVLRSADSALELKAAVSFFVANHPMPYGAEAVENWKTITGQN